MQRYEKRSLSKYYQSIKELPALNFIEIYETQSLIPLSRTGKLCKRAPVVFDKISDELIDTFGVSDQFKRRQSLIVEHELMLSKLARTGDRSLLFEIQMTEKEIKDLSKDEEKSDLYRAMVWMNDQGLTFKENEITVFQYYKYLEYLSDKIKAETKPNSTTDGRKR